MKTAVKEFIEENILDYLKPPEEEFPDICCEECKNSSYNRQKNLYRCECYGIFVEGNDTCDEAEK